MGKAILVLLCVLLLVTGCSKSPYPEDGFIFKADPEPTQDWDVSFVAVPNQEMAIAVAQSVFDVIEKDEITETFAVRDVLYDEESEAWVVVFWHDLSKADSGPVSTGSIYITIREKDAKLLSVFFGEFPPSGSSV